MGFRNAPTLMYAALIPSLNYEDILTPEGEEIYAWEGGLFHDGRARDQFAQVREPFLNPLEMNIPDEATLAHRIRRTEYADDFRDWIGNDAWRDDQRLTYHAYRALVEFLKEPFFRPFDARIDAYLAGDRSALTPSEQRGLDVFRNAGGCADCHPLEPRNWDHPLLSDFGYDNLGVPSRGAEKDPGLGRQTKEKDERGQFRAPTLRNVALTAPYMHNGSMATLREVVEFYNKRDLEPDRWGPTDYPGTVNRTDLGNLALTGQQVDDLVALFEAFTDRTLLRKEVRDGKAFPTAPPDTPSTAELRLHFPDWTHRLHSAFPGQVRP